MGNCMETCCREKYEEEEEGEEEEEEEEEERNEEEDKGVINGGYGGVRVKIMLTKEELEWMMFQLKDNGGKTSLEDVLREIDRSRSRSSSAVAAPSWRIEGWKPSLESIMESPEVLDQMDR